VTLLVRPLRVVTSHAEQKRSEKHAAADAYAWRMFLRIWRRHRPKSLGVVSSWPVPINARWIGPGPDPLLRVSLEERHDYLAMYATADSALT
jgi:hypothetical protein